jgi:hypothetical protein
MVISRRETAAADRSYAQQANREPSNLGSDPHDFNCDYFHDVA